MIETKQEPSCSIPAPAAPDPAPSTHTWFVMGKEDNGEVVSRCNHCKTLRYEMGTAVRYEVPGST